MIFTFDIITVRKPKVHITALWNAQHTTTTTTRFGQKRFVWNACTIQHILSKVAFEINRRPGPCRSLAEDHSTFTSEGGAATRLDRWCTVFQAQTYCKVLVLESTYDIT